MSALALPALCWILSGCGSAVITPTTATPMQTLSGSLTSASVFVGDPSLPLCIVFANGMSCRPCFDSVNTWIATSRMQGIIKGVIVLCPAAGSIVGRRQLWNAFRPLLPAADTLLFDPVQVGSESGHWFDACDIRYTPALLILHPGEHRRSRVLHYDQLFPVGEENPAGTGVPGADSE